MSNVSVLLVNYDFTRTEVVAVYSSKNEALKCLGVIEQWADDYPPLIFDEDEKDELKVNEKIRAINAHEENFPIKTKAVIGCDNNYYIEDFELL